METKPIKLEVKMDAKTLYSFMLRHTYTSLSGIIGLLISGGALVLFAMNWSSNDDFQKIILLIIGLLFTVVNPFMLYTRAKAQALTNPMYKETLVYTLDDQGVHLTIDDSEESLEWNQIIKWKKTNKVCILYTSKIHAILLPYASMNGQKDQVERLIKANVKG